jgi:hypothetical protein
LGILGTCEQFAAGLGAGERAGGGRGGGKGKGKENQGGEAGKGGAGEDAVGNAPLRLWVGGRFLGMSFFLSILLPPAQPRSPPSRSFSLPFILDPSHILGVYSFKQITDRIYRTLQTNGERV